MVVKLLFVAAVLTYCSDAVAQVCPEALVSMHKSSVSIMCLAGTFD
jgi:hypothetical protein